MEKKEMNIEMADEFETKPEEEQNKREQAKRDLADLQKLMAQVQGDSSAKSDRDTQPKPVKQEAVSVDELIDRAASEAEQDAEPQDAEQAEQGPETPSQIDETQSDDTETKKPREEQSKPEESESTEPEASETPEEKQQAEQEQREQVLNQQKRRRQAAQAAAGTPIELDLRKKTAEKTQKQQPHKTHKTHKDARLARKRRRQLIRMGTVLVVFLVALVLIVSIVRGIAGSGKKDSGDAGKQTISAVSKNENKKDNNTPASQQESKQYLAIKDDTTLPDYAKKYPGMYATAATTQKKLSDKKVCYLTFDDGPSDTCTPQILDILKKYHVKATFFVVTSEIDGNEKLIQRIIDEGHTLCIHANEHEYKKIYASPEAYLEDFAAAYDKIYALTGYKVQGFRFPGGSNGQLNHYGNYDAIIKEMTRRGFEYYDWNAYDHDAEGGSYSASQLAQYAVHEVSISSRNDVILLMHDTYGKENTVKALPSIIEGIQKEGIECLPITKTTRPVHFSVNENTPAEYTEETSSEDSAKSSDSSSKSGKSSESSAKSSSSKSETKN